MLKINDGWQCLHLSSCQQRGREEQAETRVFTREGDVSKVSEKLGMAGGAAIGLQSRAVRDAELPHITSNAHIRAK
ncbi:hypothetical protein GCM10027343_08280 [Noviherbaspirillum agri]